jgi:hypothetical protein
MDDIIKNSPVADEFRPLAERSEYLVSTIRRAKTMGHSTGVVEKEVDYFLKRLCELGEMDLVSKIYRAITTSRFSSLHLVARNALAEALGERVVGGSAMWVAGVCEKYKFEAVLPIIKRYAAKKINAVLGD